MLRVKYMRNGNVHGLVKVSTLQWWHTSSHDFIHQKQVACYDRTKKKRKKETKYSIHMLYTVTIKQKEHINLRQRKKCPDERSCSSNFPHTEHIVYAVAPHTSSLLQHWTIHHTAVTTVLRSWRWVKDCPKHVELIQRSIKLILLHLVGHLYYSPTLMMHGQTQIK